MWARCNSEARAPSTFQIAGAARPRTRDVVVRTATCGCGASADAGDRDRPTRRSVTVAPMCGPAVRPAFWTRIRGDLLQLPTCGRRIGSVRSTRLSGHLRRAGAPLGRSRRHGPTGARRVRRVGQGAPLSGSQRRPLTPWNGTARGRHPSSSKRGAFALPGSVSPSHGSFAETPPR